MTTQERNDVRKCIDVMQTAKNCIAVLFGKAARDADYDKAVIYQLIRDTMSQQIDALENLIIRHREEEE